MGSYAYTLICAAVFTAVICSLSPDSAQGKIGKYISFAAALILALVMLSPIVNALNEELSLFIKNDIPITSDEKKNEALTGEYYVRSAATVLSSVYGVNEDEVKGKACFSDEGVLEKITLTVPEIVGGTSSEARQMLSDIYGIEVEILEVSDGASE